MDHSIAHRMHVSNAVCTRVHNIYREDSIQLSIYPVQCINTLRQVTPVDSRKQSCVKSSNNLETINQTSVCYIDVDAAAQ